MTAPLMLDAYGCAGLGADGYKAAGWQVVVLDNDPAALAVARDAGHDTVQGDATVLLADPGFMRPFAFVHASPPCQPSSATRELARAQARAQGRTLAGRTAAPDLLLPTRDLLTRWGGPWVIENVERSPVRRWPNAVRLCGSAWLLKVQRHRWYAPSGITLVGTGCRHAEAFDRDPRTGKPRPWGVYYAKGDSIPAGGRTAVSDEHGHEVMGVTHRVLPWRYLCEGLPPVMTEYLGRQALAQL